MPEALGGHQSDPATMIEVIEEIARHDGSTGWIVMIGATSNALSAYFPDPVARDVWGSDPDVVTGGTLFPPIGRAVPEGDGYRVSGRWPFGSGCGHCTWLVGHCTVQGNDEAGGDDEAEPETRLFLFPASEVLIHDTWHVAGLRGTGSHHYEVEDLFVPAERSFRPFVDPPQQHGALYRMPMLGLLPSYLAAVALGIARGAIDALTELARTKRLGSERLADRPLIRARVAEAEALTRAARAFVLDATRTAWDEATSNEGVSTEGEASMLLAGVHTAHTCAKAVDLMYTSAGGASLYESSPLQRHLRDAHAVTQHGLIGFGMYETAGEMLLRDPHADRAAP